MLDFDRYETIKDAEIEAAMKDACSRTIACLPAFTDCFKKAYSEDGVYAPVPNDDWTNGFWTGQIWLAYEYIGDERLLQAARVQMESFLDRINRQIQVNHHDMGFLYSLSCVAGYKLVKSEIGREAALKAADQLITRFHTKGNFIQAWGSLDEPGNYRLIIDSLLNLPLLYWAYAQTEDLKYCDIAKKHIKTVVDNVIREDGSTWHTFFFQKETGEPDHGATCQGYRDGSAWTRGQAWGIYGLALAYRYTGEENYLTIFKKITEYYLQHLPSDLIPYWDLEFGEGSEEPRDSASAAIAACGMLEMSKYLPAEEGAVYQKYARQFIKLLYTGYTDSPKPSANGILLHSTYSKHSPYNTCNHYGVDEYNLWGDYFYMEALMRLSRDWKPYW